MKSICTLTIALLALAFAGPADASKSAGNMIDDSTINATIKADLIGSKETKAHYINVETYKGIVQLSGFVATQAEKDTAGKIAKAVEGVKEVRNSISIGTETSLSQKFDDSVTTGKVKAALIDSKDIKSARSTSRPAAASYN
jgi:hyperosmotically inducible protein